MNRILVVLFWAAVTLQVSAQPVLRNWATTNAQPFAIRGIIASGATTSGFPWVVTIPASGAATNVITPVSGTNTTVTIAGFTATISADVSHLEVILVSSNLTWIASNILWGFTAGTSNNVLTTSNLLWAFAAGISNNVLTTSNLLWQYAGGVSNNVLTTSNILWGYTTGLSNIVFGFTNSLAGVRPNQFTTNVVGTPIVGPVTFDQSSQSNAFRLATGAFQDNEFVTEDHLQAAINSLLQQMFHLWTNINPVISSNHTLALTELSDQWLTNVLATGSNSIGFWYYTNGIGLSFLPTGSYDLHVHALKLAGGPVVTLHWDLMLWHAGTNIYVSTSESALVDVVESGFTLGNTVFAPFPIPSTNDLIGLHIWADKVGGGTSLLTHYDGQTECHLATPSLSPNLTAVTAEFVLQDPLTNHVYNTNVIGSREVLSAARTYYVNITNGLDANSGLTAALPFKTLAHAVAVAKTLDLGQFNLTLSLTNGVYSDNVFITDTVGSGSLIVQGNAGSPTAVVIGGSGSTAATITAQSSSARIILQNVVITNGASTYALVATAGGNVALNGGITFGPVKTGSIQMVACCGGVIQVNGNYTVSAGAQIHIQALSGGFWFANAPVTITMSGTPAFGSATVHCDENSVVELVNVTFSGSATGPRFLITHQGTVYTGTGNLTMIPGNAAGILGSGGYYDGFTQNFIREQLTTNRTYFVDVTNGSDANTGWTVPGLKTIQFALDLICSNLDTGNYGVTLQLTNGVYAENVTWRGGVGNGGITITGDPGNSNAVAIVGSSIALFVDRFPPLTLKHISIGSAPAAIGVRASNLAAVTIGPGVAFLTNGTAMRADRNGVITMSGNNAINGGGLLFFNASQNGTIRADNATFTLTGTPAFSTAFANSDTSADISAAGTFTGSATGPRFIVGTGGVIQTGSSSNATFLPGNVAGTVNFGGIYQ